LRYEKINLPGPLPLHCFSTNVVLGLDVLETYEPELKWKQREMHLPDPDPGNDAIYIISAQSRSILPHIDNLRHIELCTMQEFAELCASNRCSESDEIWLGFIRSVPATESVDTNAGLLSGRGACQPEVQQVLQEFQDVLVSELPAGIPPRRLGVDGKPIEHTIDLDPVSKPYAAQPRKLSVDEDNELRAVLPDLLAKGWVTPSLSPHAAPVVFVRKSQMGLLASKLYGCVYRT
jgi:hypothetical protein